MANTVVHMHFVVNIILTTVCACAIRVQPKLSKALRARGISTYFGATGMHLHTRATAFEMKCSDGSRG